MSLKYISPTLLKITEASNGDVLTYVSSNSRAEWVAVTSSNDWTNANDYATYITLLANDYNSYATLITYVDSAIANLVNSAPETLDTLNEIAASLGNDANLAITLTTQINSIQANVYALNLDTIVANGNTTSRIIEVSGIYSNNFLIVDGPSTFNSNIFINGSIEAVDFIKLNTSVANDTVQGQFSWNYDEGTVHLGLNDSVSLKIGQDSYFYVKAAQPILKGNVVYASGAVGNSGNIEVSLYIANNSIEERYILGIAAQNISQGELGYVTALGFIRQFNASGALAGETWNLGDILYPSATVSGGLTNQPPEAPNQDIPIAFVTSNSTNGSIAVRAFELGYHLNEIHDVYETDKQDSDVLTWVASNARWEPKSISIENAYANDYATYITLDANIYNTFAYLNANIGVGSGDGSNAWTNANDYSTYISLKSQIDLVNSNTSTLGNVYSEKFEVDGSTNTFTLSSSIVAEEALLVYIDGVLQHSDAYQINGLTLTLSNTLPLPVSTLGVRSLSALAASGTANLASDYFVLNGSTNTFTLSRSVASSNNILVSLSGVVQSPDQHYVISGNSLTLSNTAPLVANISLEVRHLSVVSQSGSTNADNTWINSNDYTTYTSVTANLFNTYQSLSANASSGSSYLKTFALG